MASLKNKNNFEYPAEENSAILETETEQSDIHFDFQKTLDGFEKIVTLLTEIKHEFNRVSKIDPRFKKAISKPKSKVDNNTLIYEIIKKLSEFEPLKEKLAGIDSKTKLYDVLEYELFLRKTDNNNIHIYDNGFLHNNLFNFSSLDNAGFEILLSRFYEMVDQYKLKYINYMLHNIMVPKFNYSIINKYLTDNYSEAVDRNVFTDLYKSFHAITTKDLLVPVDKMEIIENISNIKFKYTPHSKEYNIISIADMEIAIEQCKKVLKNYTKIAFFSYISYDVFKVLYDIVKEGYPKLEDISNMYKEVNGFNEKTGIILFTDLMMLISNCKKYANILDSNFKQDIKVETKFMDELAIIKDGKVVGFSASKFVKLVKGNREKSLKIYIDHLNSLDFKEEEKKEEEPKSDSEDSDEDD